MGGRQGVRGGGDEKKLFHEHRVSFWRDENVLELVRGVSCIK